MWKASSKVAVKVVTRIAENVRQIEQEYQILSQLSGHENFPEFFGLFLNKEEASHEIWFAMEVSETLWNKAENCENILKLSKYKIECILMKNIMFYSFVHEVLSEIWLVIWWRSYDICRRILLATSSFQSPK